MLGESALRFQVDGQASQEYTSSHVASMHLTLDAAATVRWPSATADSEQKQEHVVLLHESCELIACTQSEDAPDMGGGSQGAAAGRLGIGFHKDDTQCRLNHICKDDGERFR